METLLGVLMSEKNTLMNYLFQSRSQFINIDYKDLASLFLHRFAQRDKQDYKVIFVFNEEDNANQFSDFIDSALLYPGIGSEIYSSMNSSTTNLTQRFSILQKILQGTASTIVTTHEAIALHTPPTQFFGNSNILIVKDNIYPPDQLAQDLVKCGYSRTLTVEEEGTFALKGEILDIYPIGSNPIRISYFDEIIEAIFPIDISTHKSIRDSEIIEAEINSSPKSLFSDQSIQLFKQNIPRVHYSESDLYEHRKQIISNLNNQSLFDDYPLFLSFFFDDKATIHDYLKDKDFTFIFVNDSLNTFEEYTNDLTQQFNLFSDEGIGLFKPKPEDIYSFNGHFSETSLQLNRPSLGTDKAQQIKSFQYLLHELEPLFNQSLEQRFTSISNIINSFQKNDHEICVYYSSEKTLNEIKFILQSKMEYLDLLKIKYIHKKIPTSFILEDEKVIVLSDSLFFAHKSNKVKKASKMLDSNLFAEQLSTLEVGDYVVHKDHGIGKYLGTESLSLNNSTSDYIVLSYKDEDKVYVPVYKMSLLQKHSTSAAQVAVANLKTNKFDQIKNKARQAIKKLAFNLLELEAKRRSREGFQYSEPGHDYNDFELSFPYEETPDQKTATENVISDMTSTRPMDRLICGDVGFGKTEIAMRACFLAVVDCKQVAILVPTTVLAYQHFNSFKERFKNFPVNVEFISRFKTAKQSNIIAEKLQTGQIDILIGTHKILSDKFKFKDLGLVIIDEEQRFGVSHKEKLKLLRETVDSLTLTATPIPRTLHQSFLGIKELSLIKTPPPRRQSIKTYVIKEDASTLRMALEKELARGGQVFVVHNRVNDIENYTAKIRKLVPKARVVFAHGQMGERDLERIISEFYEYKFDILVSTTIIESGIDIPRANTMIIDQANNYGLSQLHQLRGRIGRSDKKAYAYFVIPSQHKLSEVAAKRLRAIQTYAELGSGFSLASTDLEIRGSGDVLGAEQSGHINSIGLELYTELLREAVADLKGEPVTLHEEIEITTPFNAFIPETYIEASNIRLKYYKILSSANVIEDLNETLEILTDQYGALPLELLNLSNIIKSRVILSGICLKSIRVKSKSILLQFDRQKLDSDHITRDKVINLFSQRPKIYKLNPDYSINCNFKDTILIDTLLEFSTYISAELSKK